MSLLTGSLAISFGSCCCQVLSRASSRVKDCPVTCSTPPRDGGLLPLVLQGVLLGPLPSVPPFSLELTLLSHVKIQIILLVLLHPLRPDLAGFSDSGWSRKSFLPVLLLPTPQLQTSVWPAPVLAFPLKSSLLFT